MRAQLPASSPQYNSHRSPPSTVCHHASEGESPALATVLLPILLLPVHARCLQLFYLSKLRRPSLSSFNTASPGFFGALTRLTTLQQLCLDNCSQLPPPACLA